LLVGSVLSEQENFKMQGSLLGRAFRHYFDMSGRANRQEYFTFLTYCAGTTGAMIGAEQWMPGQLSGQTFSLAGLFLAAHALPLVGVFLRRLRDAGQSVPVRLVPTSSCRGPGIRSQRPAVVRTSSGSTRRRPLPSTRTQWPRRSTRSRVPPRGAEGADVPLIGRGRLRPSGDQEKARPNWPGLLN
jgi:hypothetical protein